MEFIKDKNIDVVCIGHALMDVLVEVDDQYLLIHDLQKGGMQLVEKEAIEKQLVAIADRAARSVPGGSAANTARGVSVFGGKVAFFGAVGTGVYGSMYRDALKDAGVAAYLHDGVELTGVALTYITPDHERTFAVHLGAASDVPQQSIEVPVLTDAKVVHLEGFQFEGPTRDTLEFVLQLANEAKTLVSLDLNDAGLIERNLDLFQRVVKDSVDIVFVNESEAAAFTGETETIKQIEVLRTVAPLVILKCGSDGAHIITSNETITIAAEQAEVADTTGAGDLFAAGFLYGITRGQSYEQAGILGAKAAAKIISQIGVDTELLREIV